MRSRNTLVLVLILLLAAFVLFIVLPIDHPRFAKQSMFWQPEETRDLKIKQGLESIRLVENRECNEEAHSRGIDCGGCYLKIP